MTTLRLLIKLVTICFLIFKVAMCLLWFYFIKMSCFLGIINNKQAITLIFKTMDEVKRTEIKIESL